MKDYTFGIENEVILLGKAGNCAPVNTQIINAFQNNYPKFKTNIKPELDACQVELVTGVHESLNDATTQSITLTGLVSGIARDLGYTLAHNPAPHYPSNQRATSTVTDPWIQQKYLTIDKVLRNQGVRGATNIAGLHINIGHPNPHTVLALHHALSSQVHLLLNANNLDDLAFHPERFAKYQNVVNALKTAIIFVPEDGNYVDDQGNPKDQGHSLVRLKKYGDQYVTEVRTPRGGYDENSIKKIIATVEKNLIIPAMQSLNR